jgi:protein-S-isoprenylcysteine O-methyltransferase Ste14
MQVAYLLFAVLWIAFYGYWLYSAWKTKNPVKHRQPRGMFLLYGFLWVIAWVILVSWFLPGLLAEQILPDSTWTAAAGLIITIAGLGFAVWARVHLGRNWSGLPLIHEQHTLTRTGPYRYVRHPIYSGITLALLGTAIGTGYVIMFTCVPLVFVLFVVKSRMEERVLIEEFRDDYARYRREVKALIPYVF